MKKILSLILLVTLFSCNNVPKSGPVDFAAEEVAIKGVFETLFNAVDDKNIDQLASLLADDGLFMGTDPGELFSKDTIVAGWAQMMKMPEIPPFEFVSEPVIRISPDGKTAIVVQQFKWNLFTTIPLRQTFWLIKGDAGWLIEFFDFSFVPYNEQIPLLNKAVSGATE